MRTPMKMQEKIILRVVARACIPFILLFGLYVQFHGDFGPGGGFQAGVIFAAAFILYGLIFGLGKLRQVISARTIEILVASGLLLYAAVGFTTLALGGNFLDYRVIDSHDPMHGLHYGILIIELGVGITVTAAMLAIFYAFAGRERRA
jgi:multicomponent Na+:H+ antiporter subunit B